MKRIVFLLTMALCIIGCNSKNREKQLNSILEYEKKLELETTLIDPLIGQELITMYVQFASDFPKDTLAPMYWLKASDVAANINRTDLSIRYLDTIIFMYPNYEKIGECYFMKGFVYETVGQNAEKAREAYNVFLEKFPNHPLAHDTRIIMQNLGLSNEELIEKILRQNAEQDSLLSSI